MTEDQHPPDGEARDTGPADPAARRIGPMTGGHTGAPGNSAPAALRSARPRSVWSRWRRRREGMAAADPHADYAAAVVAALTPEFPDLADPHVAQAVLRAVAAHHAQPEPGFEVILDAPVTANWRLRNQPAAPGRVRVACYRFGPPTAEAEREDRANRCLPGVIR